MEELIRYNAASYDLEGLLGLSEQLGADFLFMIQDEEEETYYLDRQEIQKYDSGFGRFMRRVTQYLERDENRGLFILFAVGQEDEVMILNGKLVGPQQIHTGDVELSEEIFYGLMLQEDEGIYVFKEVLYIKDKGDDHVERVTHTGDLAELAQQFIETFQ